MSQISRLHSTEIANGNLIDATHLNNEFNQLVSESNSQDTRLTSLETTSTSLTGSLKSIINGLVVQYSTASRVLIKTGSCRDSGNTELMEVTSDITVDLATSGANGLDTGAEAANTWYYVWLIKNPSTGTVAGLFSTSSTSPTMPSGYTKKRLLPIAVRNDGSSNIIEFIVGNGWPFRPEVMYVGNFTYNNAGTLTTGINNVLSNGTATTDTTIGLSSYIPDLSTIAIVQYVLGGSFTGYLRTNGGTGHRFALSTSSTSGDASILKIKPDASRQIDYKRNNGAAGLYVDVIGFVVTEV